MGVSDNGLTLFSSFSRRRDRAGQHLPQCPPPKPPLTQSAAERAPSDASAPARHPAAEQAASAETGHPAAAETAPDFETYTAVVQALMSCQERINNYRRMITELTEVLEKLESLNGYYLSCIIARETRQTKE